MINKSITNSRNFFKSSQLLLVLNLKNIWWHKILSNKRFCVHLLSLVWLTWHPSIPLSLKIEWRWIKYRSHQTFTRYSIESDKFLGINTDFNVFEIQPYLTFIKSPAINEGSTSKQILFINLTSQVSNL